MGGWCWRWPFWWCDTLGVKLLFLVQVELASSERRKREKHILHRTGHMHQDTRWSEVTLCWMQEMLRSFQTLTGAAGWRDTDGLLWWYVDVWPGGKPFCCELCPVPEAICSSPSLLWLPVRTLVGWAGEKGGACTSTHTQTIKPQGWVWNDQTFILRYGLVYIYIDSVSYFLLNI